jgi:4-amino-4-deoxy-L-arabinose transferase-like glycosyltransferase
MNKSEPENSHYYLIISFAALLFPLVLLCLCSLDDNRLTSWQWTFHNVNPFWFFCLLAGGIVAALVLSRFEPKKQKPFVLFLVSFLAAACFWDEPEVLVDAARYITQAKQLSVNGVGYFFSEWGKDVFAWTDLPLVPFLYGLLFKFFGESRLVIQICTTLFFSGTVVMVYFLGKLLWDEETGFNGALLLLAIPYLYTQIPLMLVDVPTMFLLLLAVYLYMLALKNGGVVTILLSGLGLFCVFYAKYSTWVLLAGLSVTFLTSVVSSPGHTLKRTSGVIAFAAMLIGVAFYLKQEVFLEQIRFLFAYQKPGLGRWGEGYLSTFLFQIHIFVTAGMLWSAWAAYKKGDYRYLNIACFVLIVFLLNLKRVRYTLPLFPFIVLLASYGINEIGNNRRIRRFIVLCAVCSSLVVAQLAYLPFLKNMSTGNIQAAGVFLNEKGIDGVEVVPLFDEDDIVNPVLAVPLLDYFTEARVYYASGQARPDLEKYRTSSLRFTWEYQPPPLYRPDPQFPAGEKAVAIIGGRPNQQLSPDVRKKIAGFAHQRSFNRTTGVFRYQTIVSVYYN